MAHAQRLEVEVKVMRTKVKQLEEALTTARASASRDETDIFNPSSPPMPGAYEDLEDVAECIGSFSIGSDGAGKYHGRFAGSEVCYLINCLLTPHKLIPVVVVSVTSSLGKALVSNQARSTLNSTVCSSPMKTNTKADYLNPFDLTNSACHQRSRSWQ